MTESSRSGAAAVAPLKPLLTLREALVTLRAFSPHGDASHVYMPNSNEEGWADEEVKMAARKYKVSYSPISKELEKTIEKLRAIRAHVSRADKKKIDLNIRALKSCNSAIRARCRSMDLAFQP
jgi:hypothetical protein